MLWRFDPRHLRTLESVARLGSFAAAADELGYTQSAVSQQLGELERRAGARVVTRRPVRLTEAGQVLLETEAAISASMSRATSELDALADGAAGEVRLGAFISAATSLVPPALARLRASHPGVHVTLHEIEQSEVRARLVRGDLDLAIGFDYEHDPDETPAGLVREHLTDDPIMVALPAAHPRAGAGEIDPAELSNDNWIGTAVAVGVMPSSPERPAAGLGGLTFRGQDFHTALNLVAAGLGAALLPRLSLLNAPEGVVAVSLQPPGLVRRLHTWRLDTRGISAAISQLQVHLKDVAARRVDSGQVT